MNIVIRMNIFIYSTRFCYCNDNDIIISVLDYDNITKKWILYTTDENDNKKYEIKNLYKKLSEEEYFQLSLVWDYKFPLILAYKIIQKAQDNYYNFSVFKAVFTEQDI